MLSPVFTVYQDRRFVFFSGPNSDNGFLSNWYEAHFSMDSHDFENSEQAFLYLKALRSGDEATAMRVFAMCDPGYFVRLSRQIRPFDARRWASRREDTMRQVVREKFQQNDDLREALLSTGDATIVSCSSNVLWSCGFALDQAERLDPERWVGQNLLGSILTDVREELRPPEPEPEPEPVAVPEAEPEPVTELEAAQAGPSPSTIAETVVMPAPTSAAPAGGDAQTERQPEAVATPASEASPAKATSEVTAQVSSDGDAAAATEPGIATETPAASPIPGPDDQPTIVVSTATSEEGATAQLPVITEQQATTAEPPAKDEPASSTSEATPADKPVDAPQTTTPAAAEPAADDSSDPIVRRYESGALPTASELSDGSVLKHLMRLFAQEDAPEVRRSLMQCLRDSIVIVPANKVDPLIASTVPVREDGTSDPLIMDAGKTYRPNVLENAQGERWFPAFSSEAEVDDQIRQQATLLSLPMAQCVEIARTHGGLSGIVVNVFTENLILPGRTCDYIAGLPAGTEG